jgi:DNA-binding LacI/PurR family transcriptional regulator
VLAAAKELNYHPSLVARGLATKETKQIAVLVKSLQNPYYSAIHEGIQNIAAKEGYIVSVLSAHNSPKQNMNTMLSRGMDGVIVAAASSLGDFEDFLKPTSPMAFVSADVAAHFYRKAVFDMVGAFHNLGHRRIAFLSGLSLKKASHYRYRDFMDALHTYGMESEEALLVDGDGTTDEQSGYLAADTLLKRGVAFTGVFATNDRMAMGAMKRFREAGLRIPEDISICGCDDIFKFQIIAKAGGGYKSVFRVPPDFDQRKKAWSKENRIRVNNTWKYPPIVFSFFASITAESRIKYFVNALFVKSITASFRAIRSLCSVEYAFIASNESRVFSSASASI